MQNEETDATEIKYIEIKNNTCFLGARPFRNFSKQKDPTRKVYILLNMNKYSITPSLYICN